MKLVLFAALLFVCASASATQPDSPATSSNPTCATNNGYILRTRMSMY